MRPDSPAPGTRLSAGRVVPGPWLEVAVPLSLLTAVLYGGHLGDGYLSDDFLYLGWAEQGLGELLRHVTVDSDPQMLRPLPALAWLLDRFDHGAVLLHILALILHAVAGILVARIAWHRQRRHRWRSDYRNGDSLHGPLLFAALLIAFPLLVEPVVWLSSCPDRLATCAALFALERALAAAPRGGPLPWSAVAITTGLFLFALLSKESVLLLPAIALCVFPRATAWRPAIAWGAIAGAGVLARLIVFGSLGGYASPGGGTMPLAIDAQLFARNIFLQLPFRVLVPLKNAWASEAALAVAAMSALLLGVLATGVRRPKAVLTSLAAMILALLPAASVFSIDVDHENSRLLYFPAALLAALGARAFDLTSSRPRAAGLGLLVLWSACTWINGRAWGEAGREVRGTLDVLAKIEGRFAPGATILVAGHDTWRGAMTWRNGFTEAVRRAGLRRDLDWRAGTAALIGDPGRLGIDAFEISVEVDGRWIDRTACQRALWSTPARQVPPISFELTSGMIRPGMTRQLPWIDFDPKLVPPAGIGALAIVARQPLEQEVSGRLWWRGADERFHAERFRVTNSRAFRIAAGQTQSIVRLPGPLGIGQQLGLRFQLADPRHLEHIVELRGVEIPDSCRQSGNPAIRHES